MDIEYVYHNYAGNNCYMSRHKCTSQNICFTHHQTLTVFHLLNFRLLQRDPNNLEALRMLALHSLCREGDVGEVWHYKHHEVHDRKSFIMGSDSLWIAMSQEFCMKLFLLSYYTSTWHKSFMKFCFIFWMYLWSKPAKKVSKSHIMWCLTIQIQHLICRCKNNQHFCIWVVSLWIVFYEYKCDNAFMNIYTVKFASSNVRFIYLFDKKLLLLSSKETLKWL